MRHKECEAQPLRAAAYIRVSTVMENQDDSFENQKEHFEELLSKNKQYENAGIYSDYGISGTSIRNREGLQSLLLDCKKGRINRIYCKSLSRFARNALEFLEILSVLRENGVTVYFEKENLDTAKSLNDIVVATLAAVAEEESISISENTRWANAKRYSVGEVPNELIYGYRWSDSNTLMLSGYKYRNIEVVPEEAEVVRRVFEEVAAGKPYIIIARSLNAEHVIPPLRKNDGTGEVTRCRKWLGRHIYNIITNERYTGCVRTQKTFVSDPLKHNVKRNKGNLEQHIVPSHHPAIISQELYKQVQAVVEKNSGIYGNNDTGTRRVQILTGVLVCPKCGRNLNCNGRSRVPYWFCPEDECSLQIEEQTVFKMIETAIQIRFGDSDDLRENIRKMYDEIDHLIGQKNQINNDLVAAKNRQSIVENQLTVLEEKLLDIKNENVRQTIIKSISLLKHRLDEETNGIAVLEKKSEEITAFSVRELKLYDLQQSILNVLKVETNTENIHEAILHNNIRGIITKVIVHSSTELSVYWLDNSVTKINGGALYG